MGNYLGNIKYRINCRLKVFICPIINHSVTILLFFFLSSVFAKAQQPRLILPIGHTDQVNSAEFSADGRYVVTASNDNTAKIWETISGKLIYDLKGHTAYISSAEFSPD